MFWRIRFHYENDPYYIDRIISGTSKGISKKITETLKHGGGAITIIFSTKIFPTWKTLKSIIENDWAYEEIFQNQRTLSL